MKTLARLLRVLGTAWLVVGGLLIALGNLMILITEGFGRLQEILSPFNVWNLIAVVLTLGPGFLLRRLAENLERRDRRAAITTSALLVGSLVLVVGVAWVIVWGTRLRARDAARTSEQVHEYRASAIAVKNKSAIMYEHRKGWVLTTSGPVGKEGIPDTIRLNDVISVNGRTIRVQYILVSEYKADMVYRKQVLARKGDVKCTVVESEADIPSDSERDRLWVRVGECEPLN